VADISPIALDAGGAGDRPIRIDLIEAMDMAREAAEPTPRQIYVLMEKD